MSEQIKFSNQLAHETSPYLLQHAHNPVNWFPWGDEAWALARKENKPVIVSIGYSACHWCHVMEKESFEDTAVANLMNEHFICIKVDREERPDVDQVYMTAVQLMTGAGGWPLNCITLPDGRPIYGGTYFPKNRWMQLLQKISGYYQTNPQEAQEYADKLVQGIAQSALVKLNESEAEFHFDSLRRAVETWKNYFDPIEGGNQRAPKFPMPNNYEFMLRYYAASKEETILNHVLLTLDKMAFGGIYDQLGGGFARYSTDMLWKVPHFEKMLYDNAQLITLYSLAYQLTKKDLYRQVVFETCEFIEQEMTAADGGFYSALDADSEGEEGKFYTWTQEQMQAALQKRYALFAAYYSVNEKGRWEKDGYILLRDKTDQEVADQFGISISELKKEISEAKKILLAKRNHRIRPGLDDKQLTSWNALMIKAYCDAYNAFGEPRFLDAALRSARHLLQHCAKPGGGFFHSYKNGRAAINGFLEDYSFTTEALMALYQCTLDEQWLHHARATMDIAIENFFDPQSKMFFFTSSQDDPLIARQMEVHDNVIPASNSSMAKALFLLGIYFNEADYSAKAAQMLHNVQKDFEKYPSGYSNWMMLMLQYTTSFHEVVIAGADALALRNELATHFLPHVLFAGTGQSPTPSSPEKISLLENRLVQGKTLIYVCENRTCKLPVEKVTEALKLLDAD